MNSVSSALRAAAAPVWDASLAHPFVRGLGDGTLDEAAFQRYIRQDYRFLIDYGRLLSLGAARAPRVEWMRRFAGLASSVLETEMALHREFAARWGVSIAELEAERAAPATAAYCDFLLRIATLGDFGELARRRRAVHVGLCGDRRRARRVGHVGPLPRVDRHVRVAPSSASWPRGRARCWTRSTATWRG